MDVAIAILTLLLLAAVVRFLSGPLRARPPAPRRAGELEALEAAREAKYREIRDCELDFRTGKLSREDYEATDAQLRSEAIEILDRLEAVSADADAAEAGEASG